jgi:vacuolar-type H+-ATPase subunit C/Vma6
MLRDAQDYGSLNVHMRAQRTELFTAGTYNLLAGATDFANLRQMLAQTRYDDIIGAEMVKRHPNLIEIDRRLTQNFVDQYNIYRKFIPKRARNFINAYSNFYFLSNVKVILSALHGANRFEDARGILLTLTEEENRQTEELYKSRDIEDLITQVENEDLRNALDEAIGEYKFLDLVYPLIIAVDQYYFSTLCKEMNNLKGADKESTKSFFSTKIGIQNLEIILRSKTFEISPNIVKNWIMQTKFCPLRTESRDKLIATQDLEEAFKYIRDETTFKELANRLLENIEAERPPLENFDRYADQFMAHKANSLFRGASFNIGIFPAFFYLKELEIRNLRTIILGKIHKRSINDILDKIVIV